jgi:diadenosine tetraphosphatase ApaH/serine/threonine PP2A family protein phosphatase
VLALLYDVHGNLPALDAVLADARVQDARRYLVGGDVALFGPWPAETVARLEQLADATWIRGNADRWLVDRSDAPPPAVAAAEVCVPLLGETTAAELAELPFDAVVGDTRFVHASPVSDVRSFFPEPLEDEPELVGGVTERRLVFGHTHLPFQRQGPEGIDLVNPGSVGMPLDGDLRAAWALIHDDGRVEHRRVTYDHEPVVAAVRERYDDPPWLVRFAEARFEAA